MVSTKLSHIPCDFTFVFILKTTILNEKNDDDGLVIGQKVKMQFRKKLWKK